MAGATIPTAIPAAEAGTVEAPSHDVAAADRAFRRISLRLLPLLTICYILAYIDRQNVGFAKLDFMRDLGFSSAVYGLGGGLFYLGYSLFEVPSNLMLQRIGARATLLRIMVGWGLCATLFAFMSTPFHFYTLRLLLGVAEAGFFPGILLYISFWVPPSRRAAFTAMFMAAMPISGVIGAPLSGALMVGMDGIWGLRGWQWMFLVEGVPSVLMGLVVYRLLPDRPADARWLADDEKTALEAELAAEARGKKSGGHADMRAALGDVRFWGLAAMSASLLSCIAGFQLWMPTVLRGTGVSDLLHIGFLAAIPPLLAIATQQYNARRSDRRMERRWHAALPTLAAGVAFAVLPLAQHHLLAALACLIVIAVGLLSSTGPFWTLPATYLSGTAAAGGIALITTLGGLASFGSASIVGVINEASGTTTAGLFFYAGMAIAGPLIMLATTRERSR